MPVIKCTPICFCKLTTMLQGLLSFHLQNQFRSINYFKYFHEQNEASTLGFRASFHSFNNRVCIEIDACRLLCYDPQLR